MRSAFVLRHPSQSITTMADSKKKRKDPPDPDDFITFSSLSKSTNFITTTIQHGEVEKEGGSSGRWCGHCARATCEEEVVRSNAEQWEEGELDVSEVRRSAHVLGLTYVVALKQMRLSRRYFACHLRFGTGSGSSLWWRRRFTLL